MVQRGRTQLSLRHHGFSSHGDRVGFFWLICLAAWVLVAVLGIFGCDDGLSGCGPHSERVGSAVAVGNLSCSAGHGILVPLPGIEPESPALQGRFLTTGPPGKYLYFPPTVVIQMTCPRTHGQLRDGSRGGEHAKEARMGAGRGGPATLRLKRMVLILRRKPIMGGTRGWRGPRSPGGGLCVPSPAHHPPAQPSNTTASLAPVFSAALCRGSISGRWPAACTKWLLHL